MLKKLQVLCFFITVLLINAMTVPFVNAEAGLGPNGGKVKVGENIIQNPGFENNSSGAPVLWDLKGISGGVIGRVSSSQVLNGSRSLELSSTELADSMVFQRINAQPDKYYRIILNVLPKNIKNQFGAPHLVIYYGNSPKESTQKYFSTEMKDTGEYWSNIGFYIKTLKDTSQPLYIALELGGGLGDKNSGTAYFDDISMQLVENPEVLQEFEKVTFSATGIMQPPEAVSKPLGSSNNNFISYRIAAIVILIILVIAGYIFLKKRSRKFK